MMQILFNGLVTGMLVALPALAVALTFSVLRFANFAIGAMITVGAYLVYTFNVVLGLPLLVSGVLGAVSTGLVAVTVDLLVFRRLRERSAVTLMVASMGVSFILENIVRFIAGNTPVGYDVALSRPWRWSGLRINVEQVQALVVCAVALFIVWVIFRRSSMGRAMRAIADNAPLAATRGVSRQYVITITWFVAGVLAALAGTLIGLDATIDPQMGWLYALPAFAAAILGGLTHPLAAIPGALVMGVLSEVATLVLPSHYRSLVAFVVMSLLLVLRPAGLFGTKWLTK
ncbi:branched-chain amino acid ABC transporter permease [Pollutimonas nitritireducens]|uniref:Branched-chain amino acid ABC transporter permease n=1 Tax=Pollutimonas nitritireducens TaxID=2045209 RepID=A0A2N4UAS2_9BURK|nr:branched-chain amino acid ABC transporter permease [Pollutimonas nitritireducens]PLC52122.1 branched-chain amino acid ABC transporter permease [Pollutimonas nitritireducens]